jgi:hypothetical protein
MIPYQCRQTKKGMINERLRGKQRRREWRWGNAGQPENKADAAPELRPDARPDTPQMGAKYRLLSVADLDQRTADKCDEFASFHSITSSARAKQGRRPSRPSAFAVRTGRVAYVIMTSTLS